MLRSGPAMAGKEHQVAASADRNDREEVRALVDRINGAWMTGRPEELRATLTECFDDAIVIVGPHFHEVARGKDACIGSYEDFVARATLHQCRVSEPRIDVWGDTAVVTYAWEMTYEIDGEADHDAGQDAILLVRTPAGWRATWRALQRNGH